MQLPNKVNILGAEYKITYVDKPSDVDIHGRYSYWGQVDHWTRTIRIYKGKERTDEDVWQTIFHEMLHAIVSQLHLNCLDCNGEDYSNNNHKELDILATTLVDVLFRNGWMNKG